MPLDIFIVDKKSNLLFFNQKGEKTLILSSPHTFPKSIVDLISNRDKERFKNTVAAVAEGKEGKF